METSRSARARVALVALLVALVLTSCSGDDEGDDRGDDSPGRGTETTGRTIETKASPGKVTGSLKGKVRKRVVAKVAKRVDRWFDAAWVDVDYPRKRITGAWPGFTKGLVRQARHDRGQTTNTRLASRIEGATAVRKKVTVDIMAVKGRAVGSTARFLLVLDTQGDVERRVKVRGSLSLTPGKGGWRVFGYDVRRSVGAIPDATQPRSEKPTKKRSDSKRKGSQ